jgi:hypothetical protein
MTTTIDNNVNGNVNATDNNEVEARDEFGRLASEKIVELSTRDAEEINVETEAGKHSTYDDALHYVIAHGLKEIKRLRKAAEELRQARIVKERGKLYTSMLAVNPQLVADPNFVAKMLSDLGVKSK